MEILYHRIAKQILGVDKSTSNMAALVRLGWMPLDYRLAYRACCWYMKIRLGDAGTALENQYERMSSIAADETWAKTCFYKPAHDFLERLDSDLLALTCFQDFRCKLRKAVFAELTQMWSDCSHAPICHVIHPVWAEIGWTRLILSKQTCSWYHQIAVGRGKFGDRYRYSRDAGGRDTSCRLGCNSLDTVYHFFFDCKFCSNDIDDLRMIVNVSA